MNVTAPSVATHSRSRTPQVSPLAIAVIFAIVASVSLVALTVWRVGPPATGTAANNQSYAAGYPLHGGLAGSSQFGVSARSGFASGYPVNGGLAGPSQLGGAATSSYRDGYPLHGGLAGPARISVFEQHQGFAPGYPRTGGLAGPSGISAAATHPGYGIGYPLHGGLAGPSQVDE